MRNILIAAFAMLTISTNAQPNLMELLSSTSAFDRSPLLSKFSGTPSLTYSTNPPLTVTPNDIAFNAGVIIEEAVPSIDTVVVRNLQMQAQDWAWIVGSLIANRDSISLMDFRRIRAKVQQSIPPNWTTNITVDSLHGSVVINFYNLVMSASAGTIASRYDAIRTAISSKTNLSYWIGFIDASKSAEFTGPLNVGKNVLIDQ